MPPSDWHTLCLRLRWENPKGLTASERRILLANWYYKATVDALAEEKARHAYFKHAGALLTADCTDDELIKLEGVPKGEEFSF